MKRGECIYTKYAQAIGPVSSNYFSSSDSALTRQVADAARYDRYSMSKLSKMPSQFVMPSPARFIRRSEGLMYYQQVHLCQRCGRSTDSPGRSNTAIMLDLNP